MHQKSLLPPVTQFADGCKAVRHMDGTYEWIGGSDRIHASSDRSSDTAATTSEVGQASEAAKGFGSSGHGANAHAMASLNASIRRKNALERYKVSHPLQPNPTQRTHAFMFPHVRVPTFLCLFLPS